MESASRNGAVVPQDTAPEVGTVEIATAATALRWSRPDLTAALAEHLMEVAAAVSDRDGWLVAAGWRVHAVGATGDARDVAADVLEALPGWGADALSGCASERLRLELAVLAHDAGEHDISGALLDGVSRDGRDDADVALAAEAATARLRCRRDEGSGDPAAALAAWDRLGGAAGDTGAATVLLVAAATDRRIGRAGSAVTRAVDGLGRLDRARTSPRALSPSPHLAAALAAEWISALIGAGRPDQSREGSRPLRERLVEYARPTRQLALLRLTLARVAAEDAPDGGDAAKELERAAHDAAASDAPELEYICRTALGEVHEAGGRMEQALESLRLAAVAERRHRSRAARFRAAVAAVPGLLAGATRTGGPSTTARGPAASPVPVATGEPGSARRPSGAAVEPPGRAAAVEPVPPPDGPGPAAAVGRTAPGSIERTTVLRPVRQSSTAAQKPGDGSPRRGPVVSGAGPDGEQAGPTGTSRPLSNGSASGAHGRSGTNGTAVPGTGRSGANPAGPWADRAQRNAPFHPDPSATGPNEGNGHPPRRPEAGAGGVDGRPGSNGSGSKGSGLNGSGLNGSAVRASGRYPHGAESGPVLPVDETDPPVTAPMNPWATGVWTAVPLLAPADRPGDRKSVV